jgi:hypothetical protein
MVKDLCGRSFSCVFFPALYVVCGELCGGVLYV